MDLVDFKRGDFMALKKSKDEDFDEKVLEASKERPVVVDFWAEWCMPCKQLKPTIEEIGKERDDIDVVKVNIDEADEKPQEYGVRSVPNVKLFVDGKIVDEFIGNRTKEDVLEWIDENI